MDKKQMTEKESLELISQMIQNSKRNVKTNAGGPSLIWGYATVFTSILIYLGLIYIGTYEVMFGWFLIPIIGGTGMFILSKREQPVLVKTFLDKVINYIWMVFGILAGVFSMSAFMFQMNILFIIGILMSAGIILTGCVTNFKPYIISGILGALISILCLVFASYTFSILIFAGVFVVAMIIPGHMANSEDDVREVSMKPEISQ